MVNKNRSATLYGEKYIMSLPKNKVDWIRRNHNKIPKKDIRKWILHSQHHTVKHLGDMLKNMKKNNLNFNQAHTQSMVKVGK